MTSFRNIVGQSRSLNMLQTFLKNRAIPQALLFQGGAGVGKRAAAEAFAKAILCKRYDNFSPEEESPPMTGNEIEPCGQCLSCRKFENQNHPDMLVIEPDGASIKIEQIRQLQGKITYKPIDGTKKIILIDPADKMNTAAANGLLKTLEEPPSYVVLILVTGNVSSLPTTLLSRCQKILFHMLSFSQIVTVLKEKKGWTIAEARNIAAAARGQLTEAFAMDVPSARKIDEAQYALVSGENIFETALHFSGDIELFEAALSYLTMWFRDVLVFKSLQESQGNTGNGDNQLIFSWRAVAVKAWASRMEAEEIFSFMTDLQAVRLAQARNVNRQLSLEMLLVQLQKKVEIRRET